MSPLSFPSYKPILRTEVLQVSSKKYERAGVSGVDLCPTYADAGRGQECGAPKLIVRISGGLCVVYMTQGSGNSNLVPTDCSSLLRAVGALHRLYAMGGRGRPQTTQLAAVGLTNSDRQLTHSSKRTPCLDWRCVKRSTSSCLCLRVAQNAFLPSSAAVGQIPAVVRKW